jgi:hypothetical protein
MWSVNVSLCIAEPGLISSGTSSCCSSVSRRRLFFLLSVLSFVFVSLARRVHVASVTSGRVQIKPDATRPIPALFSRCLSRIPSLSLSLTTHPSPTRALTASGSTGETPTRG